jgi:hypothetical protein
MTDRFPHLTNNNSDFPYVGNVDVYKYDNDFDYSRYDYDQMEITICKVPWDMGEAHIGNRTISGIGNVVWFETKAKRDAWFDAIPDSECVRYTTKYKQLHRDNKIRVDIPFDVASNYNYVYVRYNKFANDDSPIEGETDEGRRDWFWFVREVEFVSPNTTILHLLNDAWQTFIYDIDISSMILERGHAPMFSTSVAQYLENPIENCADLLAEDETYDTARIVTSVTPFVFNAGTMYALVITNGNVRADWGSKSGGNWAVQGLQAYIQGATGYGAFAIAVDLLDDFLAAVHAQIPQFLQTVQAVSFVSGDMITLGDSFTFAGITCYDVNANWKTQTVHDISVDDFGYDERYSGIAKLYTYPYAYIEVTDEGGNVTEIRIEDTNGTIALDFCMSVIYPWLRISGMISSVGKAARQSVSFENISGRNMPIAGNALDMLMEWNIPTYGVMVSNSVVNDYATYFDRAQTAYAGANRYANAIEAADTGLLNAGAASTTNSAIVARSNQSAYTDAGITQTFNTGMAAANNILVDGSANSTISAQEMQGAISAASSVASGAIGAIGAGVTGNVAGAASAIAGGIIGAVTSEAQTSVATGLTAAQATYTKAGNSASATANNTVTGDRASNQASTASDIADHQNWLTNTTAAYTAAMQKANAARDLATVNSSIDNQIAQAALGNVNVFGDFANGTTAGTKPLGVFSQVVTQSEYAIERAGDLFLRYGYALDKQWQFDGNWTCGHKFCYWKLVDFWISGLNVPDMYVDKIRFFLFGGVTVWHDPADIGNITIYENTEV